MTTRPSPRKGKNRTEITLTVQQKRAKALDLKILGYSYERIAQEVGWKDRSGAARAVKAALASIPADQVKELRQIELLRLDLAQRQIMPGVVRADLGSIDRLLKIMDLRARLVGLYEVQPDTGVEAIKAVLGAWLGQVREQDEAEDASLPSSDLGVIQLPREEVLLPQIESYGDSEASTIL